MKKLIGCMALVLVALAASAQWSNPTEDIPAYNVGAPSKPLPAIMAGGQLSGPDFAHSYQKTVYQMAAKIPNVLHQQPCYCRCDREMGHNSLHSCFESTHGAACSTCMKEAMYTYLETKKGKSPGQIRSAIERGEWMKMDLDQGAM